MSENSIQVRPATPADSSILIQFNAALARETEGRDLDATRLEQGVQAVFDDPKRGEYYVAELDGRILGSLMLTREWSDWRNGSFWWIQSVFVHPEARRQGVYRRLYEYVEMRARGALDVCGIRLYVERTNEAAQQVYSALGMCPNSYSMFEVDFVLPAETSTH